MTRDTKKEVKARGKVELREGRKEEHKKMTQPPLAKGDQIVRPVREGKDKN